MEYFFNLTVNTESKNVAHIFVDLFKDTFQYDIVEYNWEIIEKSLADFQENGGILDISPEFKMCIVDPYFECLEDCFKKTAQNAINDSFSAEFIVRNNSSDYDNVYATFTYKDNKLAVSYINADSFSLFCEECDEYYDTEIATIVGHTKGKEYKCPGCGAVFTFEETEDSREYVLDISNE